jgi:hypothetical protein
MPVSNANRRVSVGRFNFSKVDNENENLKTDSGLPDLYFCRGGSGPVSEGGLIG